MDGTLPHSRDFSGAVAGRLMDAWGVRFKDDLLMKRYVTSNCSEATLPPRRSQAEQYCSVG